MSTNTENSETPPAPQAPATVSPSAWLRMPVTLTIERWVLVAAGLAALILLLVALD